LERGRAVIAGPGPAALGRRRDVAGSGVSAHDQFDIAGFDNHLVAGTAVDDFQDLGDGRLAQLSDIADVAAFLASERAGFITGATIPVDGGILTT
jgi:3-oxoacyl-[acyl-carrier protein] reductase